MFLKRLLLFKNIENKIKVVILNLILFQGEYYRKLNEIALTGKDIMANQNDWYIGGLEFGSHVDFLFGGLKAPVKEGK